jgi:uncharacterized protein YjbI with pentapeptide repeats
MESGLEPVFLQIFQQGVYLKTRAGLSLSEVLEEAGFSRKYLEERVRTVFLDGTAIDDLDNAIIRGDCVIALSAAMPGLAGAILRKGSPISVLRSSTPAITDLNSSGDALHTLRLKLFNAVAKEMGPELLRSGILLKRSDLEQLLSNRLEPVKGSIMEAELDGCPVSPADLLGGKLIHSDLVFLQVTGFSTDT